MMKYLKFIPLSVLIAGCSTTPDPLYVEPESATSSVSFVASSSFLEYDQGIKGSMKKSMKYVFSERGYRVWLYESPELCNESRKVDVKNLGAKSLMLPTSNYVTMKIAKHFYFPEATTRKCENVFSFKMNENNHYLINHKITKHGCSVTVFDDVTNKQLKLFERDECSVDELESSKLTDFSGSEFSLVWY